MEPGGELAVGGSEDTGRSHVIGVADGEGTINGTVVSEGVPVAAYFVVNVLAELGGVGVRGVAHLQTEDTTANEAKTR